MTRTFSESVVEDVALGWLKSLGYVVIHGSDIAAGEPAGELQVKDVKRIARATA